MTSYDAAIIQTHAERLYRRADFIVLTYVLAGFAIGGGVGWIVGTKWLSPVEATAVGAVLVGLTGYWVGSQRAFTLRFMAQMALCQSRIEANTRAN